MGRSRTRRKPCPTTSSREVGNPQLVRFQQVEVSLHQASRAGRLRVRNRVRLRLPRCGPPSPSSRIRRSMMQRAESDPSRSNCDHTFRAP